MAPTPTVTRAAPRSIALMQPYFFPYLGYLKLVANVDSLVFYDDVPYIRGGWINRNRWLLDGTVHYFTVPLQGASSFRLIRDIEVADGAPWRRKLLATLHQHYRRAPHFEPVSQLFESVLAAPETRIAGLAKASVRACAAYLGLPTHFVDSSTTYDNAQLRGQARVLDVCRRENATTYVNLPAGRNLYEPQAFAEHGLQLRFIDPADLRYAQPGGGFVPDLSIIDTLMCSDVATVRAALVDGAGQ